MKHDDHPHPHSVQLREICTRCLNDGVIVNERPKEINSSTNQYLELFCTRRDRPNFCHAAYHPEELEDKLKRVQDYAKLGGCPLDLDTVAASPATMGIPTEDTTLITKLDNYCKYIQKENFDTGQKTVLANFIMKTSDVRQSRRELIRQSQREQ